MPYSPFNAKFAKPLPRNVLDLVKEKWAEASAEANGGEALPPFKAFRRSRPKDPHLPGIAVYRRRTHRLTQGNMLLGSTSEFAIEIADEDKDDEALLDRLELRVEVVHLIVYEAALDEPEKLYKDFPDDSRILATLDIPEHVYGNNVSQGSNNLRVAALTLTCELTEA